MKYAQIQELLGIITYLDEVLTMSARLGAVTGDTRWEERYRRFEPGLDAAIQELKKLAPDIYSDQSAAQTDVANIRLVEMGNQAFKLMREGRRKESFSLLNSDQYEQQKRLYAEGMRQVSENLYRQIEIFHGEEKQEAIIAASVLVGALVLLLFTWVVVLRMVRRHMAEQKSAEERLNLLAHYDALTGLPNRTLFCDRLGQALAQAGRTGKELALLFLDLDRFKKVNDSRGHSIGDLLLKGVAERLTDCVRKSDTVARFGGDEFVLLLTNLTRKQDASKVAAKVLIVLSEPLILNGCPTSITASIGITFFPSHGRDAEHLLKNADIAMYYAKEQGRNNYQFFRPELKETTPGLL